LLSWPWVAETGHQACLDHQDLADARSLAGLAGWPPPPPQQSASLAAVCCPGQCPQPLLMPVPEAGSHQPIVLAGGGRDRAPGLPGLSRSSNLFRARCCSLLLPALAALPCLAPWQLLCAAAWPGQQPAALPCAALQQLSLMQQASSPSGRRQASQPASQPVSSLSLSCLLLTTLLSLKIASQLAPASSAQGAAQAAP